MYIYIHIYIYIYIVLICKNQQLASFHAAIKYIKQIVFKYICQIFVMSSTVFISPVHLCSKTKFEKQNQSIAYTEKTTRILCFISHI